jgi:hypothetical protein
VTVPLPVPAPATDRLNAGSAKEAVTFVAAFTTTVHGDATPLQPPLQPLKVPPVGVAVRKTDVPPG